MSDKQLKNEEENEKKKTKKLADKTLTDGTMEGRKRRRSKI
ncbi:hypothetical protein OF848_15375 [Heyndrickxia coagulans]|nr:hypothetical protein [Heyndrickxia coagulans]UYM81677.1 hypothetical protein OF848_15375 [Heyndrickxia coagulans]